MIRAVLGIVIGFIVWIALVVIGIAAAYVGMGPEGMFQGDSYDVTVKYVLVCLGIAFLAAILGGYTCAAISHLPKPPVVLAVIILVFGILDVLPYVMTGDQEVVVRPPEVSNLEIAKNARPPIWLALVIPIICAAGVLGGAQLRGKRDTANPK